MLMELAPASAWMGAVLECWLDVPCHLTLLASTLHAIPLAPNRNDVK